MTRRQAIAECRRRNAELPADGAERWLPRKGREGDWTVIKARVPARHARGADGEGDPRLRTPPLG